MRKRGKNKAPKQSPTKYKEGHNKDQSGNK